MSLLTVAAMGCSSSRGGSNGGGGTQSVGSPGSGGSTGNGGSIGKGGATGNGGATGSGGATGNGGATGSGGATGKGGATGSGGTVATGGTSATGGASATGGSGATGGPGGQGGGVVFPPGGISFPWPIFDGSVPDTAPASGSGKTWYADPINGKDTNDGKTLATAKQTLGAVLTGAGVKAGDTILLAGGVYREYPNWYGGPTGTASAPITIGSYGHGTGAPILDGGIKPATWTKYTGGGATKVWQTSTKGISAITSSQPVEGVYVNSGTSESALREVIHGQVSQYGSESLPPNVTQTGIKDNSNNFYFDASGQTLYADFGGTLGSGDPNTADISILYNTHDNSSTQLLIALGSGHGYFHFVGLTVRAASWSAIYTETNGNTFDHCDVKFNGGSAFSMYGPSGATAPSTGNSITHTRIWMNVLVNWPRFNNGYTSGGWPATIQFGGQSNGLIQGNVVYQNGGEGVDLLATYWANALSMNNQVLNNVIFDNFSVNLYLDNTTGASLQQNFVFQHPLDESQTFTNLFETSPGYGGDYAKRMVPPALSLGDEPGSSFDGAAHEANITVINNIFAGGLFGFTDYDDGTSGTHHGLKNCTIENNTFILGSPSASFGSYVWSHTSSTDASTNSLFENNLFQVPASSDQFILIGKTAGVTVDYNLYSGPGQWNSQTTLAKWQSSSGWDAHSKAATAMLVDPTEFTKTAAQEPVYDWSKAAPASGSPAKGGGTSLQVTTDFTGAARASGANDVGALNAP
jgi:hypothetical protein